KTNSRKLSPYTVGNFDYSIKAVVLAPLKAVVIIFISPAKYQSHDVLGLRLHSHAEAIISPSGISGQNVGAKFVCGRLTKSPCPRAVNLGQKMASWVNEPLRIGTDSLFLNCPLGRWPKAVTKVLN